MANIMMTGSLFTAVREQVANACALKANFAIRSGLLAGAAALTLAGCTSYSEDGRALAEEPTYQAGYGDGCSTAIEKAKSFSTERRRDDYLFDNDKAYRAGWRQGYLSCGQRNLSTDSNGGLILGDDAEF